MGRTLQRGAAVFCLTLGVGLTTCGWGVGDRTADREVAARIVARFAKPAAQQQLRVFYARGGFAPLWSRFGKIRDESATLVEILDTAWSHGLDVEEYRIPQLAALRQRIEEVDADSRLDALAELDLALSRSLLLYARHLTDGRLHVATRKDGGRHEELLATLRRAVADGTLRRALEGLAPQHPEYAALRAALIAERSRRDEPARVAATGASPEERASRIRLLEANLERWRWLPRDLGSSHILVNIPSFWLRVVEDNRESLGMRVVVGKATTRTPVMSDLMTTVVLNPYWNVPPSIAEGEILPALREDPDYLERHGMEWVERPGATAPAIRQRPGSQNALGFYKFVFPNPLNIYLHDTPSDHLFARAARTFSHGCIRVDKPEALAAHLLRQEKNWGPERVARALADGREVHIPLSRPLPVHIVYFTATAGPHGVAFHDDVYGADADLLLRLRRVRPETAAPQPAGVVASVRNEEAESQAASG